MYIEVAQINSESPRLYSYEELRELFPEISIPQLGDFYKPVEDGDAVLTFYKVVQTVEITSTPGYANNLVGYRLKEISDEKGSVVPVYEQIPTPILTLAEDLKSQISSIRKQKENVGIVYNGTPIMTSVNDQNRITNVLVNATNAGIESIRFKVADNSFQTMSVDDLKLLAKQIALMVQKWFDAEESHYSAISLLVENNDFDGLIAYDATLAWPDNVITAP